MTGNKLPTQLQQYIHLSRYARWLDDENRRETWEETVDRYTGFFGSRFPDTFPAERVKEYIHTLRAMPSMRALMTAGPALERDEMAGFNPVTGDTRVVTREYGNVPIASLVGTQAEVLNRYGRWTPAVFRGYGTQPVVSVRLKRNSNSEFTVRCTRNHRWLLSSGEVLPTSELRAGQRIPHASAPKPAIDADYRRGVQHGLVYGDGTAVKTCERVRGYNIRLCGPSAELLPWFAGYPVSYAPSANGDPIVMMYDGFAATHSLKTLPTPSETESYLLGFLRGWFAADGSVSTSSQATLCVTSAGVDWLKAHGERFGFIVQRVVQQPSTTNFGERSTASFVVHIHRDGLVPEDMLCSWKRANFRPLQSSYTVVAVEDSSESEPVFCAEVPDTNTFVLAGGIVTGNCSFVAVDHIRAFDEILYILMCGTGVGFSVERQSINQLPVVSEDFQASDTVIKVRDSKIGWASAFRELVAMLYNGQVPQWDVSRVRPAGAKLKVFGGRASGPQPLVDLFVFAVQLFKKAAGRRLSSVECHDLVCKIADIVVVGGVRRSALISLSNLSDDRMRVAKSGQWWTDNGQRALANNSAAYTEKPDMEIFLEEWLALIKSKSGERGIFNRVAAQKKAAEFGRRDPDHAFGTNPCLTGDMRILTRNGNVPISLLEGVETDIWNGFEYSTVTPFSTGVNPIMAVELSNGVRLKVTPNHKFILPDGVRVEAQDLELGAKLAKHLLPEVSCDNDAVDKVAYSQGFYTGDGTTNSTRSWLYEPKYCVTPYLVGRIQQDGDGTRPRKVWVHGTMLPKSFVPCVLAQGVEYCTAWLAGLLDADGAVLNNPNSTGIQLSSNDRQFLLEVRMLLVSLGVDSKVTLAREKGHLCLGYEAQAGYRLLINATGTADMVQRLRLPFARLSFAKLSPNRDASRFVTVVGTQDLGYEEETFCLTDPKNNSLVVEGVMTANCGEIILRSAGLCNLTEVVIRAGDTLDDLMAKVEVATIMGTYQSALTNYRYVRSIWRRNAQEERLLGVSMTGIMDHEVLSRPSEEAREWLRTLREHSVNVNAEWAEKIGISPSVAITTVKPSGTVSQLVDSASGIHPRYAKHYIRTVRADKKDPLAQFMRAEGFPVEDCVMKPDSTEVFSFPVAGPDHAVFRNDLTAVEQLEHYLMFKQDWCEHNPSITVYVRDHEWMAVGDWVYNHFDDVGGVSFLPHTDHAYQQAPYTECTDAEYQAAAEAMPSADWSGLQNFEKEDMTENTQTLACTAGGCEIL